MGPNRRLDLVQVGLNRLLGHTDRWLDRGQRLLREIPIVLYRPSASDLAVFDYYQSGSYGDPEVQGWGFYPFEARMLARFFPPPPARLLMHGVGGGRDLLALVRAGYTVDGHEPGGRLASAANALLQSAAKPGNLSRVVESSMQAWAANPSRNDQGDRYDGVFIGWTAWTHLLRHTERLDVLQAFRRVCPSGPVLLSFFRGENVFDLTEKAPDPQRVHPTWSDRLFRITRHLVRERLLRAPPIERGLGWRAGLYFHQTEEWELREEAALAGYEVAYYEQNGSLYPHAVLVPRKGG
jgi:hypothetical protein